MNSDAASSGRPADKQANPRSVRQVVFEGLHIESFSEIQNRTGVILSRDFNVGLVRGSISQRCICLG